MPCEVLTPWAVTSHHGPGPTQWEVVRVVVEMPFESRDRACGVAVQLAREAVPRLPTPATG